jgi:hypothetical protein
MGATKHTSGPWTIECGKNYSNEIVGKSKTGKDWVLARTTAAKVGRDQEEANAYLIAAAPDLLEALKEIKNLIEQIYGDGITESNATPELLKARAAIAKAEGRGE